MYSMARINTYLQLTSHAVQNCKQFAKIHCILGNQAADADSCISSLVLAFYKEHKKNMKEEIFIPVMPITRDVFRLRPDTPALLKRFELDLSNLIFLDEIDLVSLFQDQKLGLILTDHNELGPNYQQFEHCVEEIFDHHFDSGKYLFVSSSKRQIAFDNNSSQALVGSCCTLIAEEILTNGQDLMDEVIAGLLQGVILLDTLNLDPNAKKVTERDIQAAHELMSLSSIENNEFFSYLISAKYNPDFLNALTVEECLMMDYKQFYTSGNTFGMSTVSLPIEEFSQKCDFFNNVLHFINSNAIQVLGIMCAVPRGENFQRQLVLVSTDSNLLESLGQFLETTQNNVLQLVRMDDLSSEISIFYQQLNVSLSRKQVAPLFIQYFEKS